MYYSINWFYRRCLFRFTRAQACAVRIWAMRKLGFNIGKDVYIGPGLTMVAGYANTDVKLNIGDRVSFGPNVTLILSSHPNNSRLSLYISRPPRQITIGEDSWIGANAIVMPNITIGKCCIIGAGAVVTRDVPDFAIIAGVPAQQIGMVDKNRLESHADNIGR